MTHTHTHTHPHTQRHTETHTHTHTHRHTHTSLSESSYISTDTFLRYGIHACGILTGRGVDLTEQLNHALITCHRTDPSM